MKNVDNIFKSYDIRGISGEEITEELAYAIGNAYAQHQQLQTCVVSRDVRKNSPELAQQTIQGLLDAGCNVIDAGVTSTAQLKWIVANNNLPAGIMITASHNPKEYNGFKFYLEQAKPYAQADGMHELKTYLDKPVQTTPGTLQTKDYTEEYITNVRLALSSSEKEVFLDPSAGSACKEVRALAATGAYNFTLYNDQEDPSFSEHEPNPLEPTATEAARDYCAMNNCVGCVLDADADRLVLIDEKGEVVEADFLLTLLTQKLPANSGVAATLNCSNAVKEACKQHNHTYHRVAVGSANVQRAMREHNLELGGEKSGHIMFKEFHGAEAPLYCLLRVLAEYTNLHEAITPIREAYLGSNEQNYRVQDPEATLQAAKETFSKQGEVDELDGVFIQTPSWWLSIRKSNTEPLLRFTWEAQNQEEYTRIKEEVETFIQEHL
ncbi:MAG: hypothetical protein ACMXYD_02005 [Candidatus Woesearchaeota archaeon]